jgi:hypothetical protein
MKQGILPFRYEEELKPTRMTALTGLPLYMDLAHVMGLYKSIQKHLKVRKGAQGWTDSQMIISLILLNLAGGDCVDDLRVLEKDEGFCEILRKVETHGLRRKMRRALERRWRKERRRTVPSPSAVFRYLAKFHDAEQEKYRQAGKAFIPAPNANLRGLIKIYRDMAAFTQKQNLQSTATLEMDATQAETTKQEALFSYLGHKAYQGLNTWWAEQGIILHSEFRDGNVPAGFEQLRVFKEALDCLPEGVKRVWLRSDTAGYQHDLLRYCQKAESERFGRIEFAIGCDVTREFRQAVAGVTESEWKPIYRIVNGKREKTGSEWAEVCFVPSAIAHSKRGLEYRYLAKRKALEEQLGLPGMEQQLELPFPTMFIREKRYKVFGIVTNMDWEGEDLIHWYHQRCGKSEEVHAAMKEDLAGGKLPSGDFGENAAWWGVMILAFNLNGLMKKLALGRNWSLRRMKVIRFSLINLPGRVVDHSRRLVVRLSKGHPSFTLLVEVRKRISMLIPVPAG